MIGGVNSLSGNFTGIEKKLVYDVLKKDLGPGMGQNGSNTFNNSGVVSLVTVHALE